MFAWIGQDGAPGVRGEGACTQVRSGSDAEASQFPWAAVRLLHSKPVLICCGRACQNTAHVAAPLPGIMKP